MVNRNSEELGISPYRGWHDVLQERAIPKGRDGIKYLEVKFSSLSWAA